MTREMCNVAMGRAGDVALPLNPESFVGVLTRLNNIFCALTRATTPLFFLPIELCATFASSCISVHCIFFCFGPHVTCLLSHVKWRRWAGAASAGR